MTSSNTESGISLMYELKAIGPAYLLSDVVYPDYYLTVSFDENDRVSMIVYQENKKFHITDVM